MRDTQSSVMVTGISVLRQDGLIGLFKTAQIVRVPGYGAGVLPGVQHLPELQSVTEITLVHGDIGAVAGTKVIFV